MLIILGVVAVGALAVFFLVLGGEEEQQTAPTPPTSSPAPIPETPGTSVGEPTEEPPEPPRAVTFFGGRDPFVPLVEESVEPTDGTVSPGAPPAPPGPGEPPAPPAPGAPPAPPSGDVTDEEGPAVTGRPIVLVDVVDEESAQVLFDGAPMTVSEGQRFARRYRMVSVESNCARFLYGDESFSLCEELPPE
ncbi:MAG: hypothetical protein ACRDHM_05590 [Actinomycetota bacterium]